MHFDGIMQAEHHGQTRGKVRRMVSPAITCVTLARRLGAGLQSSVFFYLLATLCSYSYAVQAGAKVPHFASAQGGTPKPPARTHLLLGHGPPRSSGQECNQTLRRAL